MESIAAESVRVKPVRCGTGRLGAILRHSLLRFLLAGGLSTAADLTTLYLLHGVLYVNLSIATSAAVALSFAVNFTLNRIWSFGSAAPVGGQLIRYLTLAGLNWISSVALVNGMVAIGVFYLLARILAIGINSAVNYVAYKRWVFKAA